MASLFLSDLPVILSWFFFMYVVLVSLTSIHIFALWSVTQIPLNKDDLRDLLRQQDSFSLGIQRENGQL